VHPISGSVAAIRACPAGSFSNVVLCLLMRRYPGYPWGYCARAASGHVAALLSSVMKSHLFMVTPDRAPQLINNVHHSKMRMLMRSEAAAPRPNCQSAFNIGSDSLPMSFAGDFGLSMVNQRYANWLSDFVACAQATVQPTRQNNHRSICDLRLGVLSATRDLPIDGMEFYLRPGRMIFGDASG
jgi:hypothetical protein